MGPLMPWLLAATAAVAVADLVVPRPRPRRFPEDEPVSAVRAEPTRASATAETKNSEERRGCNRTTEAPRA